MKIYMLLCVLLTLSLVGCKEPSQNMQRSMARGAGDSAVTFYLDERKTHDVDEKQARILAIVAEVERFLDTGITGDLTVGALKKQVNKVVPVEYQDISNTILNYVSSYRVPTQKIPEKVLKNIRAALKGIEAGVADYKLEDRSQNIQ